MGYITLTTGNTIFTIESRENILYKIECSETGFIEVIHKITALNYETKKEIDFSSVKIVNINHIICFE